MRYQQLASLETFLSQVEAHLLSRERRLNVSFPDAAIAPWDGDALALANQELLAKVSGNANLYAIFTAECGETKHSLRYFGKTTKKLARQRITNHLFRKNEKTGSKLAQVIAHACSGGAVQVAWLDVDPESLRNYLEEELILRHPEADWNRENRVKIKAFPETAIRATNQSGNASEASSPAQGTPTGDEDDMEYRGIYGVDPDAADYPEVLKRLKRLKLTAPELFERIKNDPLR